IENGGEILLHMTDSVIFKGDLPERYYRDKKVLGFFEKPKEIKNVIILGAGRYEYISENKYTIKNRGFNVTEKNSSFYSKFNLNNEITIKNINFITFFKATTKKHSPEELGHIKEDVYNINPINLGGKRLINDEELQKTNLNTNYIKTYPIYIDKYL